MKITKKKIHVQVDDNHSVDLVIPANWINPMLTCLCSRCASRYYDDEYSGIVRAYHDQKTFDRCDICSCGKGYDFVVFETDCELQAAS